MSIEEKSSVPPCLIYIDKEGRWYHEGAEMIHRGFIRLFYQSIYLDQHGRYIIKWKGERCYVQVEDTAFVVRSVAYLEGAREHEARFMLSLSDETHEELLPDTLYVGEGNVMYCKIKDRTFPARFTRAAYYQLASYIEEEKGGYYLPLNGSKYRIRIRH